MSVRSKGAEAGLSGTSLWATSVGDRLCTDFSNPLIPSTLSSNHLHTTVVRLSDEFVTVLTDSAAVAGLADRLLDL